MVIVNKTVSLIGENKSKTFIEDGIELNTENGNLADVQIKNLYLTGETPGSHPWQQTIGGGNNPSGLIQNLVIDDNVFDGTRNFDPNLVAPGSNTGNPTTGVGSAVFLFQGDGTFTFTNNEVKNYPHHELLYVGQNNIGFDANSGSFTKVLIENNTFVNNNGILAVYGNSNNVTDSYVVKNNVFANAGKANDSGWAFLEISNADNVVIEKNKFANKGVEDNGISLMLLRSIFLEAFHL
ncbi:MAG: hypothetical protein J4F36_12300 [Nitrosopumilaceae archaeon]|nr:hypothetical protein [Nitrosopumilaceae archaeon]